MELSAQVDGIGGQDILYLCQNACLLKVEGQVKIVGIQPESFPEAGVKDLICAKQRRSLACFRDMSPILEYGN